MWHRIYHVCVALLPAREAESRRAIEVTESNAPIDAYLFDELACGRSRGGGGKIANYCCNTPNLLAAFSDTHAKYKRQIHAPCLFSARTPRRHGIYIFIYIYIQMCVCIRGT